MTADTRTQVLHDTFTIERRFKANPARVFKAWSDRDAKFRWFVSGDGWKQRADYRHDFEVGGHESSRFSPTKAMGPITPDNVFGNDTWYLDIVENRRIAFAYNMSKDSVTFSSSLAVVEIQADGAGSRLVYTEQAAFYEGADGPAMRKQGWEGLLAALEKELAR